MAFIEGADVLAEDPEDHVLDEDGIDDDESDNEHDNVVNVHADCDECVEVSDAVVNATFEYIKSIQQALQLATENGGRRRQEGVTCRSR